MGVTRQHRDCDLNLGPSAPEYSTLTTRLPYDITLELICRQCQDNAGPASMERSRLVTVTKIIVRQRHTQRANDCCIGLFVVLSKS